MHYGTEMNAWNYGVKSLKGQRSSSQWAKICWKQHALCGWWHTVQSSDSLYIVVFSFKIGKVILIVQFVND